MLYMSGDMLSMSHDMSNWWWGNLVMSDRKQEILQTAIEIIADEGYASLSMRALARASGMKLGALQYHFRTRDEMLRALVTISPRRIGEPLNP